MPGSHATLKDEERRVGLASRHNCPAFWALALELGQYGMTFQALASSCVYQVLLSSLHEVDED